jgi:hypothetical protein
MIGGGLTGTATSSAKGSADAYLGELATGSQMLLGGGAGGVVGLALAFGLGLIVGRMLGR